MKIRGPSLDWPERPSRPERHKAAEPERRESTPAEKAEYAQTVSANLADHVRAVSDHVAAMKVAATTADRAAWTKAKEGADMAIGGIGRMVATAIAVATDATDLEVRKQLAGVEGLLAVAENQLRGAPAAPTVRAPVLSCSDALLAVLLPAQPAGEPDSVFAASERAVTNIFRTQMAYSDLLALRTILSEHKEEPIARRFGRFGGARQQRLLDVLNEGKVRARAVQLENLRVAQKQREDAAGAGKAGPVAPEPERPVNDAATVPVSVLLQPETTPDVGATGSQTRSEPTRSEPTAGHQPPARHEVQPHGAGDGPPVQRKATDAAAPGEAPVTEIASRGVAGNGTPLPHLAAIQASFGHHDVTGVTAHQGPAAAEASRELGAEAFAFGDHVAFSRSPDLHTASHEAAHTIHQRGGVQLKGGIDGGSGDPYERHADAVADAVVAGKSADALLDATPGGLAGGSPTVQRKPDAGIARLPVMGPTGSSSSTHDLPPWKQKAGPARDYVDKHGPTILRGLHAQLGSALFETGVAGATWAQGTATLTNKFFLQCGDPWEFLVASLAPDDVELLVDQGRDALTMPDLSTQYHPGVQIELGNRYATKIRESLARVLPRYVACWNQHVLAEEAKRGTHPKDAVPAPAAEPDAAEVRASAPIDPYVIRALARQLTVDFSRYRQVHAGERQVHPIKHVDKVTLDIQWRRQAVNWGRATPADATAEDVAAELYGSETFAYLVTPAAPLFGFRTDADSIGHLNPTYREQLLRIQGHPDYHGSHVPAHGRPDDPANQVIGGPLGDEVAKTQAQGQGIKPTPNITKAGIVQRMRAIAGEFAWLQQSAKPWGQEALLDAAKHKVDQRSHDLASASDPAAGADWDAQSQVQLEVVQTAHNAVLVAAEQEKAFQTFPSARWLIGNLVRDYVEAAAVSDLGATARAKLAAAEQRSRTFPADLMEALLETLRPVIQSAKINKTRLDGHDGEQNDARYGAGAMATKELELRLGLAKVRDLLMVHPEKAKPELDRLLHEVTTLATEVTLVANMDSCDAAWAALDKSLSKVGTAVSWVSSDHGNAPLKRNMAAVATMRQQWREIYDSWKTAKTPAEKKAAEDTLSLKAKSKEWTGLFEALRHDIADHETYDKWVTFGAMVGIAIITGGIGVYVEAAAGAAWGTAAGFAASTAVEAATFTTLSQTLVQKDPSLATFFNEFEHNVLMFGGLKAVGKVWGVAGKALELEHDQIAASSVLVQFAALNGTALYEADRDKRKHTGGTGLTGDEIASISFHNLAFLVAMSIGQRIAKPFLAHLEVEGRLQGALLAARAAGEKVEALANQVAAAKGKDPAKSHRLNHSLADALAKREAVLAGLGEQVKLYEAGQKSTLNKAQYERIKEETAAHAEERADFERSHAKAGEITRSPGATTAPDKRRVRHEGAPAHAATEGAPPHAATEAAPAHAAEAPAHDAAEAPAHAAAETAETAPAHAADAGAAHAADAGPQAFGHDDKTPELDDAERQELVAKGATSRDIANIQMLVATAPGEARRLIRTYGEELLEQLRIQPFRSLGELESALGKARAQIKNKVEGLYESTDTPPEGWHFVTTGPIVTQDGTRVVNTTVRANNGGEGYFERAYNPLTKTLELRMAFLRNPHLNAGIPGMVPKQGESPEMIPGKGTPTVQYVTLHQMRLLGVPSGNSGGSPGIATVHLSDIQNVETVLHLHYLRSTIGGDISALVLRTATMKYAETTALQAGHRISGPPVLSKGKELPLRGFFTFRELQGSRMRRDAQITADPDMVAEHDALLAKYGCTRDTVVYWNFSIDFPVSPIQ